MNLSSPSPPTPDQHWKDRISAITDPQQLLSEVFDWFTFIGSDTYYKDMTQVLLKQVAKLAFDRSISADRVRSDTYDHCADMVKCGHAEIGCHCVAMNRNIFYAAREEARHKKSDT